MCETLSLSRLFSSEKNSFWHQILLHLEGGQSQVHKWCGMGMLTLQKLDLECLISKTTLPHFCEKPSVHKLYMCPVLTLWTWKQVSMSKLYAEYVLVSQDSFNRAKKWVQELQRQGMAANLSLFLQHCGKNSILSLGIVVSLGLHVLSIVSCDMQATQILWWLLLQTKLIWIQKERLRLR